MKAISKSNPENLLLPKKKKNENAKRKIKSQNIS